MAVPEIDSRQRAQAVRDLHDVVIHCVTEVRVHAAALTAVTQGSASVEAILDASGRALSELRRMHELIDPEHTISYAPQPDLDALQDLLDAERLRRPACMQASRPVPAGVAAAAYRFGLDVLREVHATLGAHLVGARASVTDARLDLWLDVEGAAIDTRRAAARASLVGATVTATPAGVRARFPL